MHSNVGKRIVTVATAAVVVTAGLGLGATSARADELEDARAQIEQAGSELAEYQTSLSMSAEQLEEIKGQISQVQAQIDETQAKYDAAREVLSSRVRSDYKDGNQSVLGIILGSQDFEDFVSNLYYVASLNKSDMQALSDAKALSEQLYDQKSQLEAREAAGEETQRSSAAKAAEYRQKVKEVQATYNALSDDVKQQLADEARTAISSGDTQTNDEGVTENAVVNVVATVAQADYQDAVESGDTSSLEGNAAVQAVVESSGTGSIGGTTQTAAATTSDDADGSAASTTTSTATNSATTSTTAATTTTTTSSSTGSDWLSKATSVLGTAYVWGGSDTSGFDCSGYVNYVYGSSRGRTTYDMMESAQSDGTWSTDWSNLKEGDVVITNGGNHVGIYAGNGQIYNATKPGDVVRLSDLSEADEVGYIPGDQY